MAEAAMSDCIHIDISDIVGDALDANHGGICAFTLTFDIGISMANHN